MIRVLVVCVVLVGVEAAAQQCPVPAGADQRLAQEPAAQRFEYVQGWLTRDSHRARFWNWGWFGVNAALAVGQGIAAPFIRMPDRIDWVVGAIASGPSAFGSIFFGLEVPPPVSLTGALDCAALAEAERRMKVGRDSEAFGVSFVSHVLAVGLALVPALVLGLVYDRWESAALLFAGGVAVDEAAVLTTPTGLRDAYDAYLQGSASVRPVASRGTSFGVAPLFSDGHASGAALVLSGAF